jgi:hypothetical protein
MYEPHSKPRTPEIVDFLGTEIKVGATIVYPVRRRTEMVLKKAVVCETPTATHGGVACYNEKGRRVIIRQPLRCVVVPTPEKN